MKKMTKTLPGYPPLLLLQASHPVQVHHLLHLCSGSWSSSFAFLPIWLFHWDWTLAENWAVNSWFLLWNLFHHRLSWLRLFQLFTRDFWKTLLQDFLNKIPRPALTSLFSTPIHSITTAGPLPHFDKWCLPRHIFWKNVIAKTEPTWSYFLKYSKILTTKQQCWDGTDYWVLVL